MTSPPWYKPFAALRAIHDPEGRKLLDSAEIVTLPCGSVVFETGATCKHYLIVIDGSVRVQQLSASGREIVLYRVGPGETCVLTTSCLLAHGHYPAEGLCETNVSAALLSAKDFRHALEYSEGMRRYIFEAYGAKLAQLLGLIDEIAFGRFEVRLAKRLLALSADESWLNKTHQELAVELGSAREVVSRTLKRFTDRGWVRVHRGSVELLDRKSLIDFVSAAE